MKGRNKREENADRDDKKSDYGNISVGSILNNSFFTWKSGKSSNKDSANGEECMCKYR